MEKKQKEACLSVIKDVDLQCETNNGAHHTDEVSKTKLIVRRGQIFTLTLVLTKLDLKSIVFSAKTGNNPSEKIGTLVFFGIPGEVKRSKTMWKLELDKTSDQQKGTLKMSITPQADAPIGRYVLSLRQGKEEAEFAEFVLLFNPWCSEDSVYMAKKSKRKEYVTREQGAIWVGSVNYMSRVDWDFAQFEDKMVDICLKLLDLSINHKENPDADVASRGDPIYVSRVVSAMINSNDDRGVLQGNWSGDYGGGTSPSRWTSSHAILMKWLTSEFRAVKYGQCWVFAAVMCSVMRLLGIPCRVVTNFASAHDTNRSLTIDVFHSDDDAPFIPSPDSVWNFHVWVEAWMKRPDLGKYDGWQIVDPTPQELSDGIYCCGPAPVKAIKDGQVDLKYDLPFIFAEVNADCVDWEVRQDGSKVKVFSDTKRVGQNISTKSVGSNKRKDLTRFYKHKEGSTKERRVFKYAITRDYSKEDEEDDSEEDDSGEVDSEDEVEFDESELVGDEIPIPIPSCPLGLVFEEMAEPMNGKDVHLKLVVQSEITDPIPLSIKISVKSMRYTGVEAEKIQTDKKEETLEPGKDLVVQILVPFSAYSKPMRDYETMQVTAMVTNMKSPEEIYFAEDDIVLRDPPITITVTGEVRVGSKSSGRVNFMNPLNETLTDCVLTISGMGLLKEEIVKMCADLKPNGTITHTFPYTPYKPGKKTLHAVFDCSTFRDIKGKIKVLVLPKKK